MSAAWADVAAVLRGSRVPLAEVELIVDSANIEAGLWCERCALPSALRVPFLAVSPDGIIGNGVHVACGCES